MAAFYQYKDTELFGGAITAELPTTFSDASNFRQIPSNQEVHLDNNGYSSLIVEILEMADPPPNFNPDSLFKDIPSPTTTFNSNQQQQQQNGTNTPDEEQEELKALFYHLHDLITSDSALSSSASSLNAEIAATKVHHISATTSTLLSSPSSPAPRRIWNLLATVPATGKASTVNLEGGRISMTAEYVGIFLSLVRLREAESDVLIVGNWPVFRPGFNSGDGKTQNGRGEGESENAELEDGEWEKKGEEVQRVCVGSLRVREWGLFEG